MCNESGYLGEYCGLIRCREEEKKWAVEKPLEDSSESFLILALQRRTGNITLVVKYWKQNELTAGKLSSGWIAVRIRSSSNTALASPE